MTILKAISLVTKVAVNDMLRLDAKRLPAVFVIATDSYHRANKDKGYYLLADITKQHAWARTLYADFTIHRRWRHCFVNDGVCAISARRVRKERHARCQRPAITDDSDWWTACAFTIDADRSCSKISRTHRV